MCYAGSAQGAAPQGSLSRGQAIGMVAGSMAAAHGNPNGQRLISAIRARMAPQPTTGGPPSVTGG